MSTLILFLPQAPCGPTTAFSYTLTADGHTELRHASAPAALLPELQADLTALIDEVIDLDGVPAAYERLLAGQSAGLKTIIRIDRTPREAS